MSSRPTGKLFRKYIVVLVALVGGVLVVSGAVELYFVHQETRRAVVALEREKAVAAAERIEQFVREVERHVRGTTHSATGDASLVEQRELDFLQLLRNLPAVMEVKHLDAAGQALDPAVFGR